MGLHAKSLVVDRRIGVVGTHNFDPRSENYNTEGAHPARYPSAELLDGGATGQAAGAVGPELQRRQGVRSAADPRFLALALCHRLRIQARPGVPAAAAAAGPGLPHLLRRRRRLPRSQRRPQVAAGAHADRIRRRPRSHPLKVPAWPSRSTAIESLGIVFSAAGEDWLQAIMPVDERTRQPYGILHGGASVVLAETLGSSAGNLCVETGKQICVGLEINANHVRAVRSGTVTGTARALHVGRSTQLWEIRIEDEQGRLVCISRLTLAVVAAGHG
ncbi:hypothetical protein G6F65_013484 [Rhizopus arrhizus]|nr:hypothetical protein G6F65_013484 [Rhizopus arrhizus]